MKFYYNNRRFGVVRRLTCRCCAPDENCFTLSRTGEGSVKSQPCFKVKKELPDEMVVHSVKLSAQRWLIRNHWRLKRFIPDRYFAFRYPGGRIFLNPKNSRGMLERAFGLYENDKMSAVFRLLKQGATFIDVGGNVGHYSLLAARIVGDTGRVICFEPEPTNCRWIERSIELNGYRNISLYALALSDAGGEASLYLGTQCGFHSLLRDQPERQAGVIQVKTRALDSVLHEIGCGPVDMMKIDVEGAELQVLKGARGTLEMNPQIILLLELHPMYGCQPARGM